jgi:hypothetical protein
LAQDRGMDDRIVIRRLGRRLARPSVGALLACAVIAGPAAAQQIRLHPPAASASPQLDLSRLSSRYDAGQAMKAAGIAHTAIDHDLQGEAATASVGLLCGLQPNTGTAGAPGALGVDRDGRFLGAQLRFGFR